MVDPVTARSWGYRLLFVALILLLAFVQILPLGPGAGKLPGPDLMLALTFAWVIRRPSYVPISLLAVLFLFLDLILQRPPGLGAALVLGGSEILRARQAASRSMPFLVEWALVTVVLLSLVGLSQFAMAIVVADRPPLGLGLLRAMFTAGVYPLVVALSHYVFRVTAADPNEADALGSRL
ncbi:hypothetical protein [Tropicimonas isoalkanivorans]|uniref:Rod shape-determining protein MreD n=1 Tax=Tropicimonas isoalkanivorans TaxID=441112 RepID=A0A1I1G1N2_9RHOB|nr:hypothetical protein [Tropicimonas isoalkanivorans]SFC03213.1 rod shape-determining protein MreD [Tropicimonas isoalkanivorans]